MSGALVSVLLGLLVVVSPAHATVITIHNPIPYSYTLFGRTLDSANGLLAVGAGGEVFLFDAVNASLIRTVVSPSSEYGGNFGSSVEIAGKLLVVGAAGETVNGIHSAGRVYIFDVRTGALLNTLTSSNPEALGDFGRAVDVADGLLAVGAPFETVNGVELGRVHIFDLRTGTETITLATPNPVAEKGLFGAFGATINIAEGNIIVGAPGENDASGRVYIFDTTTGALLNTLVSPNFPLVASFGSSVAVTDKQAFVGSPFESVDGVVVFGRVYIFDILTGSVVRTFIDPKNETIGGFGRSITLIGNSLVVGAPFEMVSAFTSGRVYVFGEGSGMLKTTLVGPEPGVSGSFGWFGNAVDSTKGRIMVGAPCQAVNAQPCVGAVYIFSGVVGRGQDDSGSNVSQP